MRTDFDKLSNGEKIVLYPNPNNPNRVALTGVARKGMMMNDLESTLTRDVHYWKTKANALDDRRCDLETTNAELLEALQRGIRWHDDGPCWCGCRRKKAAEEGTKKHSLFCKAAREATDKATGD